MSHTTANTARLTLDKAPHTRTRAQVLPVTLTPAAARLLDMLKDRRPVQVQYTRAQVSKAIDTARRCHTAAGDTVHGIRVQNGNSAHPSQDVRTAVSESMDYLDASLHAWGDAIDLLVSGEYPAAIAAAFKACRYSRTAAGITRTAYSLHNRTRPVPAAPVFSYNF